MIFPPKLNPNVPFVYVHPREQFAILERTVHVSRDMPLYALDKTLWDSVQMIVRKAYDDGLFDIREEYDIATQRHVFATRLRLLKPLGSR